MSDLASLGPESLLTDADGELTGDVRDRLSMALRYIANWYKATDGSDDKEILWAEIDGVRSKVEAAYTAMDPALIFPGKTALAAYADAQLAFPAEWRKLSFNIDTIPRPDLISQAADLLSSAVELPSVILPMVADAAASAVGGSLGAILRRLWPWLLAALGLLVALYLGPVLLRRLA